MKLDKILRQVIICAIFLIPFVPLIVSQSLFAPYSTGKNFAFRLLAELAFGIWVVLACLRAEYRPRRSLIFAFFASLVAVTGVSTLLSPYPFQSFWGGFERMEGYVTFLHLFAYFVVLTTVLNTERLWNHYWYTTLSASLIVGRVSVSQLFQSDTPDAAMRIFGPLGNPILLGTYAIFHFFIAIHLLTNSKGPRWTKWLIASSIIFLSSVIVLTASRGAVLGLIAGTVALALSVFILVRDRSSLRKIALGFLIAITFIGGTLFVSRDVALMQSVPGLDRLMNTNLTDATVVSRFIYWKMA